MEDQRKILGAHGEQLAVAFCLERGFTIVARNWRCRLGEIDLIAKKDDVIHFIEVKTRRRLSYGRPEEAIDGLKLSHLERTIEAYMAAAKETYRGYQADALAITVRPDGTAQYYFVERIL